MIVFLFALLEVKSDFLFLILFVNRRGLGAARELRKGELVLSVPKVALLTTESVLLDPKISSLMDKPFWKFINHSRFINYFSLNNIYN